MQAEPGTSVTFNVEARDATGEPVEAGFSVDLVDKAVLSLQPRQPGEIVDAFYGRRGLGILTTSGMAISINRLLIQQMDQIATPPTGGARARRRRRRSGGYGHAPSRDRSTGIRREGSER